MVESETGLRNVAYLDSLGLTGSHVALAHCVHLSDDEIDLLEKTRTNVVHCPSSNLKLGSGIAPVTKLLDRGISVSLGADGAACNNRLDMFTEMRTAALLQKAIHGPEVLAAKRAMGLDSEIGTLEAGKRADVAVVRMSGLHATPATELISGLVYSAQASDVDSVIIDGQLVMRDRKLLTVDEAATVERANAEAKKLVERA
jgi:5-methylthioadenosine/S-adenosylhomocysteine deaminase